MPADPREPLSAIGASNRRPPWNARPPAARLSRSGSAAGHAEAGADTCLNGPLIHDTSPVASRLQVARLRAGGGTDPPVSPALGRHTLVRPSALNQQSTRQNPFD